MDFLAVQFLGGLAAGSVLFLVASGLSIIFGVTRIVNFAHGSFTMIGAYLAWSLCGRLAGLGWAWGPAGFWVAVLAAALITGLLGAAMEVLVLRRLYRSAELFPLLATFALVLVFQDGVRALWGPEDLLGPRAPGLAGAVLVLGQRFPLYDLVLIGLGPLVLGGLWLLFHRTRWGILVRAATQDREMLAALGVRPGRLFTTVVFLGTALAGFGGALQLPREAITLHMDLTLIVDAFVVVVVGGLGSVPGAYVAALLIGELQAFGIVLFPRITLVLVFLVMAVVLVARPHGLLGRPEAAPEPDDGPPLAPAAMPPALVLAALLAAALLPLGGDYALIVGTEGLILALFAASLHFLLATGGLVSFGHAAFFGLGAYGAALAVRSAGVSMIPALGGAVLLAGGAALGFGWFCVRRSGVYLAMLTLAFAQICWSAASQWQSLTGGDNGLLGIWPDRWTGGRSGFHLFTLALTALALWGLGRVTRAPLGAFLRAARDCRRRAEAIGLDVRRQHRAGLVVAGAAAGLAGGLYAFAKGSVFPTVLGVSYSVDALVMVLLGGLESLAGPLVGAAAFLGLKTELMRATGSWQALLGTGILLLVLAFPRGLSGLLPRRS
jgi:branched-chain amino acid transport system permease protein